MNSTNKTGIIIAFIVVVALFLFFGGGAMTGSTMYGGMMGNGGRSGLSWMWFPALITLAVGILLGWIAFGKK